MKYNRVIVAGQAVADEVAAFKAKRLQPSAKVPGCFTSDSVCAAQREVSGRGYLEAEIVESIHGFSLRYASGLQNFGLIASARDRADRSYDGAVAVARTWQAQDASRRWVTFMEVGA